jgi:hypothetical protein
MMVRRDSERGLIYEVDFSALPNQSLNTGDGAFVIDGRTWYMWRGPGGAADIVNGTGFVGTNTSAVGNPRGSSFFGLPLEQFAVKPGAPIEILAELDTTPTVALWPDAARFGVGAMEIISLQPTLSAQMPKPPALMWVQAPSMLVVYNWTATTATTAATFTTAEYADIVTPPKVFVAQYYGGARRFGFAPPVVGGWPATDNNLGHFMLAHTNSGYMHPNWGVQFIYYQASAAQSISFIIRRLRVTALS